MEWPDWIKGKSSINLGSSPTVARFLFSVFGGLIRWWWDGSWLRLVVIYNATVP